MSDSDSDDDFGPKPIVAEESNLPPAKKARTGSQWEPFHLEKLPKAEYYEHSYMHRDIVTHICVSKTSEFIITGSADGHVKFWKKMMDNIEFVKHYQAHLDAIQDMSISGDGKILVTIAKDKMIKFFEVIGFDMSNMIEVDYELKSALWLKSSAGLFDRVAISDVNSGKIRIYKAEGSNQPLYELDLHISPVV